MRPPPIFKFSIIENCFGTVSKRKKINYTNFNVESENFCHSLGRQKNASHKIAENGCGSQGTRKKVDRRCTRTIEVSFQGSLSPRAVDLGKVAWRCCGVRAVVLYSLRGRSVGGYKSVRGKRPVTTQR